VTLPNFIIEGADGVGKSTAAAMLVDKFGYNYYHEGPPDPSLDGETAHLYYHLVLENMRRPFVWDRSMIGELVYGPMFRGSSRLSTKQVEKLVKKFRREGGRSVLLTLPPAVIAGNLFKSRRRVFNALSEQSALVKSGLSVEKVVEIQRNFEALKNEIWSHEYFFDMTFIQFVTLADWCRLIEQYMVEDWKKED
jgi:hypothetical protein